MKILKNVRGYHLLLPLLTAFLLLYLLPSLSVNARQGDSTQFKITSWTSADGLSNTILSVHQDQQGYLWMGTFEGLFRFDGNKFESYNRFKTPGLTALRMTNLTGDSKGNLWISTDRGLMMLKDGLFHNVAGDYDFYIESMCLDERNSVIAIGTRDQGLFEYNIALKEYKKIERFSNDFITAILKDSSGGTWIGSEKKGLAFFHGTTWKYYGAQDGLTSTEIKYIYRDPNGSLYVCTTTGLFVKRGETFMSVKAFEGRWVNMITKDSSNHLWVATPLGVYKENADGSWKHISKVDGLSSNEIMDICFDNQGSIWLATYRSGLNQLRATNFLTISSNQGLNVEAVTAIEHLSPSKVLVGTSEGFLFTIENGLAKPLVTKTKFTQRIYGILQDSKKNIWITSTDGLVVLTPDGKEKHFTEENGLPTRQLRIIHEGKNQTYWIGTRNKGLVQMRIGQSPLAPIFVQYKYDELNRLHSTFIMSIDEDDVGNLLIATNVGGVMIVSTNGTIQHYSKEEGFPYISLAARYNSDGNIWITTSEGLTLLEDGTFFHFAPRDGFPGGNVFDIAEDTQGYCWLSTSKGIVRVARQQLLDYKQNKIASINWKIYSNKELQHAECIGPSEIEKANDGVLWFPMRGSVLSVNPASINVNQQKPQVYIESVTVDTSTFMSPQKLVIPTGNQRVVFNYTSLSLLFPNSSKFKYKLEPFDPNWIEAGTERQAVYTSLPAGDYSFQVIASNNDGIWSDAGASLLIQKNPYFYETWWFYTLSLALIGFSAVMYVRLKTKATKAKAQWLEQEVNKRTVQLKHKSETLEVQNKEILKHEAEIEEQKETLKLSNEELKQAHDKINEQNKILVDQKHHLEELNTTKDKFFSIVAHDFKSPLNALKSFSGLLVTHVDHISKEEIVEVSKRLQTSVDNTIEMADNLIRWARMQMNDYTLQPERMSVAEITSNICAVYKEIAEKKEIEFKYCVDDTLLVYGDKNQIIFAVRNLINNAIKFTHKGGTITLSAHAPSDHEVNITISDTGVGISEDVQKKLFSIKSQPSMNGTEGEKGTGLGLMLSYEFMKMNNGMISLESTEGKGTTFTIRLPNRA